MKLRLLRLIAAFCLMGSSAIPDAGAQKGSSGRLDWVQEFLTAVGSGTGKGSSNPAQDKAIAIRMAKIASPMTI